jgi:hypothetical protein
MATGNAQLPARTCRSSLFNHRERVYYDDLDLAPHASLHSGFKPQAEMDLPHHYGGDRDAGTEPLWV